MVLDCRGAFLNSSTVSSLFSRFILKPSGVRYFSRVFTAFVSSSSVELHLGHVSSSLISLFQWMFRVFLSCGGFVFPLQHMGVSGSQQLLWGSLSGVQHSLVILDLLL